MQVHICMDAWMHGCAHRCSLYIIRSMCGADHKWALFDPWFMQVGLKVVWSDMVHVLFWRATPSKWVGSKTYSKFEWPHQCWHVKYAHFFTGWATKVHSKIWVPVFGIKYKLNTCSNMCLDVNTAEVLKWGLNMLYAGGAMWGPNEGPNRGPNVVLCI